VPFRFLRREKFRRGPARGVPVAGGLPFEGVTDEWRLSGLMTVEGTVLDALNRRERIPIAAVRWGPLGSDEMLQEAPGLRAINPYDLIVALVGASAGQQRTGRTRITSEPFDVALDCPPLRLAGTVHLGPGEDEGVLLMSAPELFFPLTRPVVLMDRKPVDLPDAELALVNRGYLRDVRRIDARTMEALRAPPP
jgi:hypothetical protein